MHISILLMVYPFELIIFLNIIYGANGYYKYPTALAPLMGAGRLGHMVGRALCRCGAIMPHLCVPIAGLPNQSEFMKMTIYYGFPDSKLLAQHSGGLAAVHFYGLQKCCIIEILLSATSCFVFYICVTRFEVGKPFSDCTLANCPFTVCVGEIAERLCSRPAFLEVI